MQAVFALQVCLPMVLAGVYNALELIDLRVSMNNKTRQNSAEGTALWLDGTAIEGLRQDLFRFARLQLRDTAAAEDVVQEALAAAYKARERFTGQSQIKTWVFAILRNKIIDLIRARVKQPTQSLTLDDGSDADINELFDEKGYWRKEERPSNWGDPEQTLADEQFWRIFEVCMDALPESSARVFTMRELLGLDTDEICDELQISENNCWVILHRARTRLRQCLEESWF
jgi:RNA polymerase sigma-70 factor, ECF subfamily